MGIDDRSAEAIKEVINAILASLRQVGTVSAGIIALITAFAGKLSPGPAAAKLISIGAFFLLGALAMSLMTHVLFAMSHCCVADPGRSFVRDNRGPFICLVITLGLFTAGFVCFVFAAVAFELAT
jgi:uncharacterized BrkB/YihY/UPF0761 family membrane protein